MDLNKEIIRLEEALIASGLQNRLKASLLDEETWPVRLDALLAEIQKKGKVVSGLSARELEELSESLFIHSRMEGSREAVPEALLASVNRALDAERTQTEGIVVRLLRNGMELIQGTLEGASLELAPLVATRRAGAAEADLINPTGSRIDLKMPVARGQMHCSILQTSASEAMVSLSLKNLAGSYQLSLKKDGRLIGSHSGVKSDRGVQFDRIGPGRYTVELKGATSAEIPFSIV
ncbi:MAG: hypothetical protein KDK23_06255 [Leptospiraceae bacterium]|nr:hypothetical protein [Leptospiraceae bacterium]